MSSEIKSNYIDLKAMQLEYAFEKGVNFSARVIQLPESIDHNAFLKVDTALTELEESPELPIIIKINSSGGNVYDALAIVGRIRSSPCVVNTICYGIAYSAAILLLAAGRHRIMTEESYAMHHAAIYDVSGSHKEVLNLIKQREKEEQDWARHMAKFTNQSKDYWYKNGMKKDYYLSAEECLKLGVIDEVV